MLKKTMAAAGALALLASAPSMAADGFFSQSTFRIGAGMGHGKVDVEDFGLDGSATAWEVYGGFELNRFLAIEAGYIDGGEFQDPIEEIGLTYAAETKGLYASLLASLPISENVSLYGRAGLLSWETEEELRVDGFVAAEGKLDGEDPIFGLGIAAMIDSALLRAEYRYAALDEADFTLLSLAVVWRF